MGVEGKCTSNIFGSNGVAVKLVTRTKSLKRRKSSPKSRKRKRRPSSPPLPSPPKRLNPPIPGVMFPNSPWIWMPGSDFTPTTTKIN